MSKEASLSKLTLLYTAGNLASKVITFGLFFLYTFFLSKEEIGTFDLIISAITLLAPVFNLQIYDAILRWLIDNPDITNRSKVVATSLSFLFGVSFMTAAITFIVSLFTEIKYLELTIALTIANMVYPILQYIARGLGNNQAYVVSGVINSIAFTLLASLSLYFFEFKINGLLLSNISAVLIATIYLATRVNLRGYWKLKWFDMQYLRNMLSFSVPLIPNSLGWWVISMANRYIILLYLGVSENGTFAVAMKLPSILLMLTNIFYMAWQEKAIKTYLHPQRDEYYTEVFNKYFVLLFASLAVIISVTKPALKFLVADAYFETWKFLPILYMAIGYQALSSFLGTAYLSSKDTIGALTTTIFGAGVTVASSFLLIPNLGLPGASLAIMLGYVALFVIRLQQTKKYFTIGISGKRFVACNVLVLCTSLGTIFEETLLLLINALICIAFFLFLNQGLIRQYYSKLLLNRSL
ncbi:O-antigen/teichoic acid export membrane protein [Dyadobacter sp. BE34]|uniref:O-antigen/teichoic acid export membrane protein n=1 Tax=Dyadobacter fermentans TaxID=94254 RepID=A0ABU1R8J3_9BACT|nr:MULTISPECIES: oligosaccharide flippase family protein [Dyadobacter]MDR6809229.1 O-antigen/teichoic acid export membrane protein [Dyadobacter fermentans]MDR7046972.1 O-antigen/teichoic acid export membrane protein [Dyadobacter sp. BE242]MDR7201286.1 O-antigen/teichoic acid export membrane protein [Dyadobacter sp. BE34]MDR7219246.1 O-antigen/teichoic acid export membrane protein [Dyadobacter sp. BE31]MDR7264544.1 O-antigen/teichoic acid export membrane protein [Dyadobacter sp. BE32]